MADFIAGACVLLVVGGAVFMMVRNKKKGKSCCGCSESGSCNGQCKK